jgi:hypothetical protein
MTKFVGMKLLSLLLWSTATAILADDNCADAQEKCPRQAAAGDCLTRPRSMHRFCPKSCKICDLQDRTAAFGVRQECKGREAATVAPAIRESIVYMNSDAVMDMDAEDFLQCVNQHESCSHWKVWGGKIIVMSTVICLRRVVPFGCSLPNLSLLLLSRVRGQPRLYDEDMWACLWYVRCQQTS